MNIKNFFILSTLVLASFILLSSCSKEKNKDDKTTKYPDLVATLKMTGDETRTITFTNIENGGQTENAFLGSYNSSNNTLNLNGLGSESGSKTYTWYVVSDSIPELKTGTFPVSSSQLANDDGSGSTAYPDLTVGQITLTKVGARVALGPGGGYRIISGSFTASISNSHGGNVDFEGQFQDLVVLTD